MPNLVGIGNSQVPTNAMLGGLAYKDSVGEVIIDKIKARIGDNAVDIFVYDTRKDSDGGAWRKKTENTSWYNESVSEFRGSRKEFPTVAVLVVTNNADSTPSTLVIYDGDDPNLPMWMKYERDTTQDPFFDYSDPGSHHLGNYEPSSVSALNGIICVGTYRSAGALSNLNAGLREFHLVEDTCFATNDDKRVQLPTNTANRQVVTIAYRQIGTQTISNANVRGIAMTVMPNAPIGESTGLPIPTIAVATDGGLSVLRDDGTIVDWIESSGPDSTHKLSFRKNKKLGVFTSGTAGIAGYPQLYYIEIPSSDVSANYYYNYNALGIEKYGYNLENNSGARLIMNTGTNGALSGVVDTDDNTYASTSDGGLGVILPPESVGTTADMQTAAISYVTKDYNTGYMFGDIRGAFLSSTDDTNITGSGDGYVTGNDSTFGAAITSLNWSERGGSSGRWNVSGGTLNTGNPGPYDSGEYLDITLPSYTSGQTHVISYTLSSVSGTKPLRWRYNDGQMGNLPTSNGTHYYYVTLTETGTLFSILNDNNLVASIDDFKIQLVSDDDRSVKNKGLVAYGTVPKQPVATGAELVSYGPFSTTNRLRQPYNSDLNFETNDFSVMFWMYNTGTNDHETLVGRDNREFSVDILDNTTYSRKFRIYAYDSSNSMNSFDSNARPFPINTWSHVCVNYTGGNTATIYVNGILNKTGTLNYDIDDTSNGLNIGARNTGGSYAHAADGTKLALVRISKGAPSAEQVKKIYDHEKCLYHENSKCTLYGTSDDVNALAVDDSNNVVYVGTSSGRSDFRGLNRINNTTTAVTTAISVSNEFVAEQ